MELLERFAAGNLEAFETLFRRHQKQVCGWILRIVREPATAEDLTVETFLRIYRAHARFDSSGNFAAWSRRIATNVALDHLRRSRREVELPEEMAASARPDPAMGRELRQQIRAAFEQLPPKYRLVAVLALVEEEPYENIAAAAGISVALVKVRVFRAVRILRKRLAAFKPVSRETQAIGDEAR